jgi:predicted amidohydrolase
VLMEKMPDFSIAAIQGTVSTESSQNSINIDYALQAIQSAATMGNDIVTFPSGVIKGNCAKNLVQLSGTAKEHNIAIIFSIKEELSAASCDLTVSIDHLGNIVQQHGILEKSIHKNMIQAVKTKSGIVKIGVLSARESLQVRNHFLMTMGVELWCILNTNDNTLISEINFSHLAQTTSCFVVGFNNEGRNHSAAQDFSGTTEIFGPLGPLKTNDKEGMVCATCTLNELRMRALDWDPSYYNFSKEMDHYTTRLRSQLAFHHQDSVMPSIQIAAVQKSPCFKQNGKFEIDMPSTLSLGISSIKEAAQSGNDFVVLPEVFLGGYPRRLRFGTDIGSRLDTGRAAFSIYQSGAISLPHQRNGHFAVDPIRHKEIFAMCETAKEHNIAVVTGVLEHGATSHGSIYCSVLIINSDGLIVHKHRKAKLTAAERHTWSEGSTKTIKVVSVKTKVGNIKIAALPCWENLMPEVAMQLKAEGVQLWCAPTADGREQWYKVNIPHLAKVMNCFVVGCNSYATLQDIYGHSSIDSWDESVIKELSSNTPNSTLQTDEVIYFGGTTICGPKGYLEGGQPLLNKEGIISAQCTPDQLNETIDSENKLELSTQEIDAFFNAIDDHCDTGEPESSHANLSTGPAANSEMSELAKDKTSIIRGR